MFLWNIPGLSNKFIYTNDDVFALKPLAINRFFYKNFIKETFKCSRLPDMFGQHCDNANKLIYGSLDNFKRPDHSFKAYLKSDLQKCYKEHSTEILKSISKFREATNYNCFIYNLYQDLKKHTIAGEIDCSYLDSFNKHILDASEMVCINDTKPEYDIYKNVDLNCWFITRFNEKSKYELIDITNKASYINTLPATILPDSKPAAQKANNFYRPNTYLYF